MLVVVVVEVYCIAAALRRLLESDKSRTSHFQVRLLRPTDRPTGRLKGGGGEEERQRQRGIEFPNRIKTQTVVVVVVVVILVRSSYVCVCMVEWR